MGDGRDGRMMNEDKDEHGEEGLVGMDCEAVERGRGSSTVARE